MKTQIIESAIRSIKGCTFISMRYTSEPSLNKSQKLAVSLMGGFNEIVPIVKVY